MLVHIYPITNEVNGKYYVGQTSCAVEKRFKDHISSAITRAKRGCRYLQQAIRKYGPEKFSVQELATTSNEIEGDNLEILWITSLDAMNSRVGYNLALGGRGARGVVWDEARRAKSSKAQKGISRGLVHVVTAETRAKISAGNMGRVSPLKGVSPSLETREKLSRANTGKLRTEDTKRAISNRIKELWKDPEYAKHMSEAHTRRPHVVANDKPKKS